MAKLVLNFRPKTIDVNTDVTILLPGDLKPDTPVLYLLHGMHGDHTSWMNGSAIGWFAKTRNIAVVMPSAGNSFYSNMYYGARYYDYVAEELPNYINALFPHLSRKREKTFVAGLSMGGYGAVKMALRTPERFAAAASISGPLDIIADTRFPGWSDVCTCNWGVDYEKNLENSPDNVIYLLENFPKDKEKPRLYLACGTEDFLYDQNVTFHALIQKTDFEFRYVEGPGIHNWDFFGNYIAPAIDYMLEPLSEKG